MAALKKRSNSVDNIGHFYYDWALSKYKWTSQDVQRQQDKHDGPEKRHFNENERAAVRKHHHDREVVNVMRNFIPLGLNENDNVKKPLQNRDVNQPIKEERIPTKVSGRPSQQGDHEEPSNLNEIPEEDETIEITQSHSSMMNVLSSRLLRLRAAETLWHKDTNEFLEYVLRIKDDSLLVDVLPLLTNRVKDSAPEGTGLSMGACLEMLPALERLLGSKFEDYIIVALNMVREMIKRWWNQLKVANSKAINPEHYRCSRSVNGLYLAMVSISAIIARLKERKGRVAEKALIVHRLLDLL